MNKLFCLALMAISLCGAFSVAHAQTSSTAAFIVSPSGDTSGATDTAAIQSDITACVAAHGCTIYLHAPLYITNVNLVNLRYGGIIFVGLNSYSNSSSQTPTVTVTGSGSEGFDLSGTSGIVFHDLSIAGDSAAIPLCGVYAARTSSSVSSFGHVFDGVTFWGSFAHAAVYDFAGEGWKFINAGFNITAGSGAYFTSKNSLGVVSHFDSSTSPTPFMTLTSFQNSGFAVQGNGAHCIWFEGATSGGAIAPFSAVESISIQNSYFNASGAGSTPGACLLFSDITGGLTFIGNRDESAAANGTSANPTFAVFTNSGSGSTTSGIVWQGNQFYTNTNVLDATAANLYDVQIKGNKSERFLRYLFGNLQIADIGPMAALDKVSATGIVFGVKIEVLQPELLHSISLPMNATAIVGNDHLYDYQSPAAGSDWSYTVPDYMQQLFVDASGGSVNSATIILPPRPTDGQKLTVSATNAIPVLAVIANDGQSVSGNPSTLAAQSCFTLQYVAPHSKWLKIQ